MKYLGFCAIILLIVAADSIAETHVLALAGNISQSEFSVLSKFTDIEGETVTYEQTNDRSLPGLDDADVLWVGQGEICENAYFLNADIENKIKDFAEGGGIVISVGQDTDGGRPCETGWLPEPLLGVERGGVDSFTATSAPEIGDLFTKPNEVTIAHFDDTWTTPDDPYIMLASVGPNDIAFALLKHGMGYYVVTGIENENVSDVSINTPIMENLIYYAVLLKESGMAVEYRGKLATTWADIKKQ